MDLDRQRQLELEAEAELELAQESPTESPPTYDTPDSTSASGIAKQITGPLMSYANFQIPFVGADELAAGGAAGLDWLDQRVGNVGRRLVGAPERPEQSFSEMYGDSNSGYLGTARDIQKSFRDRAPIADAALGITGAIKSEPLNLLTKAPSLIKGTTALPKIGRVLANTGVGGLLGYSSGFAEGEGGPENRMAAGSDAVGPAAALGGGISAIAESAGPIADKVGTWWNSPKLSAANRKLAREIGNQVPDEELQLAIQQLKDAPEKFLSETNLAPDVKDLADRVASQPNVRTEIQKVLEDRLAAGKGRVSKVIPGDQEALPGLGLKISDSADEAINKAKQTRAKNFGPTSKSFQAEDLGALNPKLRKFFDPVAGVDGKPVTSLVSKLAREALGDPNLEGEKGKLSFALLQRIKERLDDEVALAGKGAQTGMQNLRDAFVAELDKATGGRYKTEFLPKYQNLSEPVNALEKESVVGSLSGMKTNEPARVAQKLFGKAQTPGEFGNALRDLPGGMQLAKDAAGAHLDKILEDGGVKGVKTFFASPNNEAKMRMVLGDKVVDSILKQLETEAIVSGTKYGTAAVEKSAAQPIKKSILSSIWRSTGGRIVSTAYSLGEAAGIVKDKVSPSMAKKLKRPLFSNKAGQRSLEKILAKRGFQYSSPGAAKLSSSLKAVAPGAMIGAGVLSGRKSDSGIDIIPEAQAEERPQATPTPPSLTKSSLQTPEAKLVAAMIKVESRNKARAVSPKGAQGLMQIMPEMQKKYGVTDPFDPAQSIKAGTAILKDEIARYGDLAVALAAYNAGSPKVNAAIRKAGGAKDFESIAEYLPVETQKYVPKVLSYYEELA